MSDLAEALTTIRALARADGHVMVPAADLASLLASYDNLRKDYEVLLSSLSSM